MMSKSGSLSLVALLFITQVSLAEPSKRAIDVARNLFDAHNLDGTLVVASLEGDQESVYNPDRASKRFLAASTFKIPNTLIALDAGVVTSRDSTFTWDGRDRGLPFWNRDHTLASAIRFSCVWCYQEIARKVGRERYVEALARMDYGSQTVGDEVDMFWLNGELKISALEQVAFLRKLVSYELPYRREHIDIVKDIMLVDATEDYRIHAKSGWSGSAVSPQVGWYVGFFESAAGSWLFAMNMQVDDEADLPLRIDIATAALMALADQP